MAYLFLISSLWIQVVWADNGTNETLTSNVTTAIRAIARQHRNNDFPTAYQDDPCANFDPKNNALRKTKRDLAIAGHSLTAISSHLGGAAGLAALVGAPAGAVGVGVSGLFSTAASITRAVAEGIAVESQELEYMKCFKKKFENFTKEFENFTKEFENFTKEFENFTKEFQEFKREFREFKKKMSQEFKKVHKKLDNLRNDIQQEFDQQALVTYLLDVTPITTLKRYVRMYTESPTNFSLAELKQYCMHKDPLGILDKIEKVHVSNLLQAKTDDYYPMLRSRCKRISQDVIEIVEVAASCFAMSAIGGIEKTRLKQANETGKTVQNIMDHVMTVMKQVKNDTIERVIPNKWLEMVRRHQAEDTHMVRCHGGDGSLLNLAVFNEFYNYLNEVHSWAEWVVVEKITPDMVKGETKVVQFNYTCGGPGTINELEFHTRPLAFMWCERDHDDKRIENAKRFKGWAYSKACKIHFYYIREMISFLSMALTSSPSMPDSPNGMLASGIILNPWPNSINYFDYDSHMANPTENHIYLLHATLCAPGLLYHVCF